MSEPLLPEFEEVANRIFHRIKEDMHGFVSEMQARTVIMREQQKEILDLRKRIAIAERQRDEWKGSAEAAMECQDLALKQRDKATSQLKEISDLMEIYRKGKYDWQAIKDNIWKTKYPDEPPASIVYQIISVLCDTTLDYVRQEAKLAEKKEVSQ